MRRFSIVLLLAMLAACDDPTTIGCTDEFVPGLAVTVVDAPTGVSLGPDALVWAETGSFVDTLRYIGQPVDEYRGAGERPGLYSVVAEREGYETWRQEDVLVTADECHVTTRELRAELYPTAVGIASVSPIEHR